MVERNDRVLQNWPIKKYLVSEERERRIRRAYNREVSLDPFFVERLLQTVWYN